MTYRERREAKVERLHEWADKREAKSEAAYSSAHAIIGNIPAGQPILVGHHSERRHRSDLARHDSYMTQSIEHSEKAEQMRSRAANIQSALDHAIYSDDPDAIERLKDKLSGLEADRDGIKDYNASCRKGNPDASLLTDEWQKKLSSYTTTGYTADNGALPGFVLSNLNGNINRTRKRLTRLGRRPA